MKFSEIKNKPLFFLCFVLYKQCLPKPAGAALIIISYCVISCVIHTSVLKCHIVLIINGSSVIKMLLFLFISLAFLTCKNQELQIYKFIRVSVSLLSQ